MSSWGSDLAYTCFTMVLKKWGGGIPNNQDTHVDSANVSLVPAMNKVLCHVLRQWGEYKDESSVSGALLNFVF